MKHKDERTKVPSRLESNMRGLAYLAFFVGGIWALVTPPRTIESSGGEIAILAWGILLLPSIVASIAAFLQKWRIEYTALFTVITGNLTYAIVVAITIPETITRGPQASIIIGLCFALGSRLANLRALAKNKNHSSE